MWRYLAGGAAALALAGAGTLFLGGRGPSGAEAALPPAPMVVAQDDRPAGDPPEASERTREQKRFDRYDKDRDGRVTRDEYLASRRKAYARLDRDGDGRLSFEEWSAKTADKFTRADRDRSGHMDAAEFATTAVKRKPKAKCPPAEQAAAPGGDD